VSRPLSSLLLALGVALTGCNGARADADAPAAATATHPGRTDPTCEQDEVRPTTGAPAEGLWLYEDGRTGLRVAAIVGPAQSETGRARLTRRVETLEARKGADTLRFASDTAAVRLQLVPPFARPASAYAVAPLVLLASYEPCTPGLREPLIRYLRQDRAGHVLTDVMLTRAPGAP
jgi:hypothetical protein